MPAITKDRAVHLLTKAIEKAHSDDLVEIYNELFPEQPTTESAAKTAPGTLVQRILDHINRGLEIEEILDLWNVIFPEHHDVWFDEQESRFHYEEDRQPVTPID
ncbi:MAG TPA: hypothetical protein VH592_23700 [Gemmataceae bacterium]|jgi:hypothetical protein